MKSGTRNLLVLVTLLPGTLPSVQADLLYWAEYEAGTINSVDLATGGRAMGIIAGVGWHPEHGVRAYALRLEFPLSWGAHFIRSGHVDTASWMGWLDVRAAPWVWSLSLVSWLYVPASTADAGEGWVYVPR